MADTHSKAAAFIEWLNQHKEDRGVLAALRRGLGKIPGTEPALYPYVVPFLSDQQSREEERAYFLVAALFALHSKGGGKGSFGGAYARLRATGSDSAEKRFTALLGAHSEDLPVHLRHAVSLLKAKDVPADWGKLLYDIRYWDHEDNFVQLQWAKDFWRSSPAQETETIPEAQTVGK